MQETPTLYFMWRFVGNVDKVRASSSSLMRRLKASKGAKGNTLTMFAEKYLVKKALFRAEQRDDEVRLPGARSCRDCGREPHVCLAVIGATCAKSTRTSGSIRKTEGPCLAYVAQHAFTTSHAGDTDVVHLVALCVVTTDKERHCVLVRRSLRR